MTVFGFKREQGVAHFFDDLVHDRFVGEVVEKLQRSETDRHPIVHHDHRKLGVLFEDEDDTALAGHLPVSDQQAPPRQDFGI